MFGPLDAGLERSLSFKYLLALDFFGKDMRYPIGDNIPNTVPDLEKLENCAKLNFSEFAELWPQNTQQY